MRDIIYCIDTVVKENKEVKIEGWAYKDSLDKVKVSVVNEEFEIKEVKRVDLVNKFEDDNAINAGFSLTTKYKDKIILSFETRDDKKQHELNIKKITKKNCRINKIGQHITKSNIRKALSNLKEHGFKNTYYKIRNKMLGMKSEKGIDYNEWYKSRIISEVELKMQKESTFQYNPKISIVVPTYNTPEKFLRAMIESVVNQSYDNWELCVADGASSLEETIKTLKEYEKKYDNIKVSFLDKNYNISQNTNEALKLVTGEYIGLFDHDDLLTPDALYEVVKVLNEDRNIDFIYSDEDKTDENESEYFDPNFKPDWSPDTLMSYNYITHFTVFKKTLLDEVGNFNSEYDGSQDYDMFLRLTEKAKKIYHIPKILYHWRVHKNSTASGISAKKYCIDAAKKALEKKLERNKIEGKVKNGLFPSSYKVEYKIIGNPKVSIIIPNKDEVKTLKKCISSIEKKSTYKNYEIIVVENNSTDEKIFDYYNEISKNEKIKVVKWTEEFNYSAINNFAVKQSSGEYIVLLNNDIEIISKSWIEEMLMHAQRIGIGCVGAKLYYPDDTVQHAGVIIGIGSVAGHSHKYFNRYEDGFVGRLKIVQNLSAVTAACLMIKKSIFNEVGGLDESFQVAFNDIDFCMKVRQKGYLNIFTPYAEMYHYESKSRGLEDTPEKVKRFNGEIKRFEEKWGLWQRDPYYNENLTLLKEDFSLKE